MIITSGDNEIEIVRRDADNPFSRLVITLTSEDSSTQFKGCHDAILFADSEAAKIDLNNLLSISIMECLIELTGGSCINIQIDNRGCLSIKCKIRQPKTMAELTVGARVDGEYREQTIRELMNLL